MVGRTLVRIKFPDELPTCPDCGEFWCPEHKEHWFECDCPGVHSEEMDGWAPAFEGPDGNLYTFRIDEPTHES